MLAHSPVPLYELILTFMSLLIIGTLLTIPLFRFDVRKFMASSLWVKIMFWVPIFIVFLGVLYAGDWLRAAVLACLLLAAAVEFWRVAGERPTPGLVVYFGLFVFGLAHFYFLGSLYAATFVGLLITLCFATVLSDVVAFFFGNYLGAHKLPGWLNSGKSWEGVAGQIGGALIGVLLVNACITLVLSIWLFIPLGVGAALGDLANSYAKRQAGIKDWAQSIPGHGGFIDRLSSMAGSALLLFYYLLFLNIA